MGSVSRDGASQQRMISATQNSPKRPNCVKFKRWHWDYRQIWLLPSICCHFHPDQYKTHWTLHCIGDEEAILKAMHPLSHKLQSDKFSNSLLFSTIFGSRNVSMLHIWVESGIFLTPPPPLPVDLVWMCRRLFWRSDFFTNLASLSPRLRPAFSANLYFVQSILLPCTTLPRSQTLSYFWYVMIILKWY